MVNRLVAFLAAAALFPASAQGQVNEYQVKAAFLYNFARYVEWPAAAFTSPTDPIRICVLGQNRFGNALDQALAGKVVNGRPLVVDVVSNSQASSNCHILFVNSSERKRFLAVLDRIKGSSVLTVGEMPDFTADGGMINLRLEDGKVRFDVNVEAAGQGQLRISSKLLILAKIVKN
jgi:hypothetical protein